MFKAAIAIIATGALLAWAFERFLNWVAFRVVADFDPHPTRGDD